MEHRNRSKDSSMGPTLASCLCNVERILPAAAHHLECTHIIVLNLMATTLKQ
jgi:hypothetical protein